MDAKMEAIIPNRNAAAKCSEDSTPFMPDTGLKPPRLCVCVYVCPCVCLCVHVCVSM